jgi:pilus assembly protein CpaF
MKPNVESLPLGSTGRVVTEEYFEIKTKIHLRLLDLLDLSLIDTLERNVLRAEIKSLIARILNEDEIRVPLNFTEREKLIEEILDEVLGLGPLEPFLQDPTVSDILINTYKQIYLERFGWGDGLMNLLQWLTPGLPMAPG